LAGEAAAALLEEEALDRVEEEVLAYNRQVYTSGCSSNCYRYGSDAAKTKQETHSKRQATQHGCLPSLLGDGDKGIELEYGEEINRLYWAD
jgi:hypothetical protein